MPKLALAIILCLSCALPVPLARAGSASGNASESLAESRRLSSLEAIRLADALSAQGSLEEAEKIYTLLLQSPREEVRVEALFKLGNIYAEKKEYGKAAEFYLAILEGYPSLSRVRLELARVYFWDKDFEKADFNFRLVQGDKSIPAEVNEKIDIFLGAIRQQKNWTLTGAFSIVPDSNLNTASGEQQECISTVYGLFCRDLEDEKSGVGVRASLTGNHYLRLNRDIGIKSTAGVSILDFPESRFDDNSIYLASGPRMVFSNGEASLQPIYRKRWAMGKAYSQSYGALLDASFDPIHRLMLDAGLSYERNRYDDSFVDSLLKGDTFGAYLEARYILNNKSFISAGIDYVNDDTAQRSYGSDSWSYSLGYFNEFPLGITAYARLSMTHVDYKDSQWFIRSDGYIEDKRRKDEIFQGYLRLSNRHWEYKGFSPAISYIYTHRHSNAWNHGYDRHRVEFSIRQTF